jgi:hypothetical protein
LTSEHEERITVEKIVGLGSPEATMLITLDKSQTRIKPARPHTNHQKVFFLVLVLVFLPETTAKTGYREISKIPPIYRTNFFKQILNSNFFTTKQIEFVSLLLLASG